MWNKRYALIIATVVSILDLAELPRLSFAQTKTVQPKTNANTNARPQVVIQREALRLIDPKKYQIAIQLEPLRGVQVKAEVDGVVRSVNFKPGQRAEAKTELISIRNTRQKLELDRATAHLRLAQVELKQAAAKNDRAAVELAQAKVEAAKADAELAKFDLESTSLRAPFAGEAFRIHVNEGQFVRAGDLLMSFGDSSQLKVEIPIDRSSSKTGDIIDLRVENQTVKAKIDAIMPLADHFGSLRDLGNSVASATLVVENSNRHLQVGQAVHPHLIPRHAIAEVPILCLANTASGQRKVQVIRDQVVRDIQVQLLAQVGLERVFVSGPFLEADEAIVRSSQSLPDGTRIRPSTAALVPQQRAAGESADAETANRSEKRRSSKAKKKSTIGF